MNELAGRKILLGISGGIAAYKTPSLVRLMREAEAEVQVVMTTNAHRFVTGTTLQAVAGSPVRDDLWDSRAEAAMGHIELARWADVILIAPATADILSRLAQGRANDLLSTVCLASRAPLLLAPAMNQVMWENASTKRNVRQLEGDGAEILGPGVGDQACGEVGPGRMVEPETLLEALIAHFDTAEMSEREQIRGPEKGPLTGRKAIVTAGPTREAIDPVRYISNHSSGRQGFAVAEALRAKGAEVVLISGPVSIAAPEGVRCISIDTARQMHKAVQTELAGCDLFFGVAAVADYRPVRAADLKIKKDTQPDQSLELELVENPDIIASVASSIRKPFVVGFAAETHDALEHARTKRIRKGLDVIIVNDVSIADIGFNSSSNAATVIWTDGELDLPKQDKTSLAEAIVEKVVALFTGQLANTNPEHAA